MPKTEKDFIPAAVKKQADDAAAKQQQAKDAKKGKTAEPAPAEPAAPVSDDGAIAVEPAPTNPEPAKPASKGDQPAPAKGDFEQKYNVLQGMYNKETHELKTSLDAMRSQMEGQQKVIDTLNKALESGAAQPAPAATPAPAAAAKLDRNLYTGYGDEMGDLIDLVNELNGRLVALEQRPAQAQADPNLVRKVENIEQQQQMTAQESFYDAMNKSLPDWGTQNKDPQFMAWLEGVDPLSQVPRNVLLEHAFKRWNANQVLAIFTQYRTESGQPLPQANANDGQAQSLADQVVPDTTGQIGAEPNVAPQVKYSTKEEFLEAQNAVTKGRMTEEDFNKIANSYQRGIAAQSKR